MLHSFNDLTTFTIRASDGRIGSVDDLYFDDVTWEIRYLVARSGFILFGHESLVGSQLLGVPDLTDREIPVNLSKDELKSATEPKAAPPPVSRQAEKSVSARAEDALWPPLLTSTGVPFSPGLAMEKIGVQNAAKPDADGAPKGDPHLRSMAEVAGYTVAATDDEIGSVVDFLIDPEAWRLQFLSVDTGHWLPGRRVVVTTDWITKVDWTGRRIHVDADRQAVEEAPRLRDNDDLEISDQKLATGSCHECCGNCLAALRACEGSAPQAARSRDIGSRG